MIIFLVSALINLTILTPLGDLSLHWGWENNDYINEFIYSKEMITVDRVNLNTKLALI